MGARGRIVLVMLAAMAAMSQFFRASSGVIAPELARDLALTPGSLGAANGGFFLALLLGQIPVGMLFDRFGARRVCGALTVLTVAGALLHAATADATTYILARVLLGLGCAGYFMGAVLVASRWFAGERFTTTLAWIFASSNLGILLAATPLAAITRWVGWRAGFVIAAGLTVVLGLLFNRFVEDAPPGHAAGAPVRESMRDVLAGVLEVWRIPGLAPVLAVHTFAYASMLTVLGLWTGPYLHDVHGLGEVARGNVLLAMGVAQTIGLLCYGPLDRVFNTRKRIVLAGGTATVSMLAVLSAWAAIPLDAAVAVLVLNCLVTAYGIVIVAHGRSLFPERLAGRGVTTVNLAQGTGCAVLPIVTGWIVAAFPQVDGRSPEIAYRLAFGAIALCLAAGLLAYTRARDSRPRPMAQPMRSSV